jgi:hypothetical protein
LAEAINLLNRNLTSAVCDPEFDPSKSGFGEQISLPPP